MLELECRRGAEGKGMIAGARLTDSLGKPLAAFLATNQEANADELAAALFEKIRLAMKFQPGQVTEDRGLEAERFRQEADFSLAHGNWDRGVQDLEAAVAIAPEKHDLRRQLASTLIGYADVQTNMLQAFQVADRAADLFLDCARASGRNVKPDSPGGLNQFISESVDWEFNAWANYLRTFRSDTFNNTRPHYVHLNDGELHRCTNYLPAVEVEDARQLLRSIYQKYNSLRADMVLPTVAEAVRQHPDDRILFHGYCYVMSTGQMHTENMAALYPEDWSQNWLTNLKGCLNLLEQLPLETGLSEYWEINNALNSLLFSPPTWRKVRPVEREVAWRLLAGHSSPYIRALGKLSQLEADQEASRPHTESTPSVDLAYRLYLEDCLNNPVQKTNLIACRLIYAAVRHIDGPELVAFCNFTLQRNDVNPDLINQATSFLLAQTNRESAGQAVALYDRAAALLQQPNVRFFGGGTNQYAQDLAKQRAVALGRIDGVIEPMPAPPAPSSPLPALPPAWREVHELIDLTVAAKGWNQIFRPVVQDDCVYAVGFGTEKDSVGQYLQLLRMPLKGGGVQPLGKMAVPFADPQTACADLENYYLGTRQGVMIFPKSGGPAGVLKQNDGLPSERVVAMDALDGKLYLSLGECGYLASYDLKSHRCETLCSPLRREQLSPFDNGSPLAIPILVADEAKHRIVFLAEQAGDVGLASWVADLKRAQEMQADIFPIMCAKARGGIWAFYPATREFKCLVPSHPFAATDLRWAGRAGDTQIVIQCTTGLALFDFATDKATLIAGYCAAVGLDHRIEDMVQQRGLRVNPALHTPPQYEHLDIWELHLTYMNSPSFVHDGWIWATFSNADPHTFLRIAMDSGRIDVLPSLRLGGAGFNPSECFRLVGTNQALIGDQQGLWLVTLTTADPQPKTAQR
jgi:hypothetical protein